MHYTANYLRQKWIDANIDEYGEESGKIRWVSVAHAREAYAQRQHILEKLLPYIEFDYKETKPHLKSLSPGCRICGRGEWSCLFINGKCNCRCFYCPSDQNDIGIPATNRITFHTPEDYADYIRYMGFRGVSISGGEPFLTFDKSLSYIEAVRSECGDDIHIWLYTNGVLADQEKILKLKDAGLNEIRFDLSAVGYDLDKLKSAAGAVEWLTVEIPAIPEDFEQVKNLLPVLRDIGVNNLNLHQLRLTPHNSRNLLRKEYTFLHGEKVTVLESELTALALMQAACENNIDIPINYCSFAYKNQYQKAATRMRSARFILKSYESTTENGLVRLLTLSGEPDVLERQARMFNEHGVDNSLWQMASNKSEIYIHADLLAMVDFSKTDLSVAYFDAVLSPQVSYHHFFKEIRVNPAKKLYVEKIRVSKNLRLTVGQRKIYEHAILQAGFNQETEKEGAIQFSAEDEMLWDIYTHERIRPGLQDYF